MSQEYKLYYDNALDKQVLEFYLSNELFEKNFDKTLKNFTKDFVYPGFRKGKVPSQIVLARKYDEILNKALISATEEYIQAIFDTIKPRPLSSFTITSFEKDKDNEVFKVTLAYTPEPIVELPDFTSISVVKVKPKQPTEDDVNYEIKNIWYMNALKENPNIRKDDFNINSLNTEFISNLKLFNGEKNVTNLDELKEYILNNLIQSYKRLAEIETEKLVKNEIIKATKYHYLDSIITQELNNRKKDYINKNSNNNIEDSKLQALGQKWRDEIEYNLKFDLLVQNYSSQFEIKVTDEEIQEEVKKLALDINYFDINEINLKNLVFIHKLRQKVFNDILTKVNLLEDSN